MSLSPKEVLIATHNLGKAREFRTLLSSKCRIRLPGEIDASLSARVQVEENGTTYYENALKKAIAFQKAFSLPVLSDDSGLEIDALGGGPGVYSARFGGENISWTERWYALYAALARQRADQWPARFRCVLCYYDGKTPPRFYEGTVEGAIIKEPRGQQGFGYDPIFFSTELGKTFAEAAEDEKSRVSHRARAINAFLHSPSLDRG